MKKLIIMVALTIPGLLFAQTVVVEEGSEYSKLKTYEERMQYRQKQLEEIDKIVIDKKPIATKKVVDKKENKVEESDNEEENTADLSYEGIWITPKDEPQAFTAVIGKDNKVSSLKITVPAFIGGTEEIVDLVEKDGAFTGTAKLATSFGLNLTSADMAEYEKTGKTPGFTPTEFETIEITAKIVMKEGKVFLVNNSEEISMIKQ